MNDYDKVFIPNDMDYLLFVLIIAVLFITVYIWVVLIPEVMNTQINECIAKYGDNATRCKVILS